MKQWSKFYLGVSLATIFVAGGVTGAMIASMSEDEARGKPPRHQSLTERMTRRLARELDLTRNQVAEIEPIIRETGSRLTNIYYRTMGMANATIEDCQRQIRPFLDPDQRVKLDQYQAKRRRQLETKCNFRSKESRQACQDPAAVTQKGERRDDAGVSNRALLLLRERGGGLTNASRPKGP